MTPRLRLLLSKAVAGYPLWDIGCDHGLLGEDALNSKLFTEVHFVDPLPHRISELRARLSDRSDARFHQGKGQDVVGTVSGNVVIAGMGAETIVQILRSWQTEGRLRARRLILSPHKDVEEIAAFARDLGLWTLMETGEFIERGRRREFFVLENAQA